MKYPTVWGEYTDYRIDVAHGFDYAGFCVVTSLSDGSGGRVAEGWLSWDDLAIVRTFLCTKVFLQEHLSTLKSFVSGRPYFPPCFFSTFAQVSFNATVRLKTGDPGFESRSAQK